MTTYRLILTEQFDKSLSTIADRSIKKQIWTKLKELKQRCPLGKKLKGNPYWSIRVNKYRIIYKMENETLIIIDTLKRKKEYREV